MQKASRKYDDDDALYAVNLSDEHGDDVEQFPEVMREFREATNAILLRAATRLGDCAVKITPRRPPSDMVRGYATFASLLEGASAKQFETMLGFKPGVLREGCVVHYIDGHGLTIDNIAPRGNTSWSAGLSPRDLHNLSNQAGARVSYDPDYPPASDPVLQFIMFKPVKVRLSTFLDARERFSNRLKA